jgi:hypothetical protein
MLEHWSTFSMANPLSPVEASAIVGRASIEIGLDGRTRRLRVSRALNLEIEPLPGADPARPVTVENDPYLPRHGLTEPRVIARSTEHTFADFDRTWDLPNRSAFYGAFRLSGP